MASAGEKHCAAGESDERSSDHQEGEQTGHSKKKKVWNFATEFHLEQRKIAGRAEQREEL